jgi:hypothetical protein
MCVYVYKLQFSAVVNAFMTKGSRMKIVTGEEINEDNCKIGAAKEQMAFCAVSIQWRS